MVTIGVLALQGGFAEHLALLQQATQSLESDRSFSLVEVRDLAALEKCDALVIPGGESTAMALAAGRLGMLEPLRRFVKVDRKPTWGTCAGLIMLAAEASATKHGGQDLIGGLDVRVRRNHYGRQIGSFETDLALPFLGPGQPFRAVFIRAPVVEMILRETEAHEDDPPVEVLAQLARVRGTDADETPTSEIVAVRQGSVFGTSFHPELTSDLRVHLWWLRQVEQSIRADCDTT